MDCSQMALVNVAKSMRQMDIELFVNFSHVFLQHATACTKGFHSLDLWEVADVPASAVNNVSKSAALPRELQAFCNQCHP